MIETVLVAVVSAMIGFFFGRKYQRDEHLREVNRRQMEKLIALAMMSESDDIDRMVDDAINERGDV